MKILKQVKLILLTLSILLIVGCDGRLNPSQVPNDLYRAPAPLTLIAVSEQGIIITDGSGAIYAYNETFHFAQIIIASNMKAGDIIRKKND